MCQSAVRGCAPCAGVLLLIAVVLITGALLAVAPASAQSGERILDYRVNLEIRDDGNLGVTEVIAYDFGSNERRGIFREIPTRFPYDDEHERVYPIEDITVTATPESTPTDVQVTTEGNVTRIRIGDPDVFITGQHTYTISYTVRGALNGFEDHDELFWNAIGTEWPVPIEQAQTTVTAPAAILDVLCFTGPQGSTLPCTSSNVDGTTARFTEDGLNPFEALTVVVGFPTGVVPTPVPILEEKLTFSTAFDPAPGKIAVGVGALVLGVVGLVWLLRKGRDRRFVGSATDQAFGNITGEEEAVPLRGRVTGPVEFEPPEGIRPGQLGTLIDEEANLLDITATIVDLAVRGFILIQEVPSEDGKRHKPDYRLTDLGKSRAELRPYESQLLGDLFETGSVVDLSELKYKFASKLSGLKTALYDDAIEKGWFSHRPDQVRLLWRGVGLVVLVAGGFLTFLAASQGWGLAALGGADRRAAAADLRREDAAPNTQGHRDVQPHRGLQADLRRRPGCARAVRRAGEHLLGVSAVRDRVRADEEVGQNVRGPRRAGRSNRRTAGSSRPTRSLPSRSPTRWRISPRRPQARSTPARPRRRAAAGSAAEGSRAAAVVEAAAAAGSPTEWAPAGRRVPLAPTR